MTRKKSSRQPTIAENPLETSLNRYRNLIPPEDFKRLLQELDQPLAGGLRLNPLKSSIEDLQDWSLKYGWKLEAISFCPQGYRLLSKEVNPGPTLEHRMGAFYLQDPASMLPAELFNFTPGSKPLVLDMAASPGGKTTHLIARTADRGLVIANDGSHSRIPALRTVLQTWGAANYAISCLPGERFGELCAGVFDAVLLDAPCSMDGLRATDAHPLRPITARERASLARRQTTLLRSALAAVRTGGEVVYSTCTLAPEEDEGVLDGILSAFPGSVEVADLSRGKNMQAPGLAGDESRVFHPSVRNAFRLWPHLFQTAGFFAAKIVKVGEIPTPNQAAKRFPPARVKDSKGTAIDENKLIGFFANQYGFDLAELIGEFDLVLETRGNQVYLSPRDVSIRAGMLPIFTAGLLLAEISGSAIEPSHDFASRFYRSFHIGMVRLPEPLIKAWLRGEDLPRGEFKDLPAGRVLIFLDEVGGFLGRGRITGERIRNLLPRRVVI